MGLFIVCRAIIGRETNKYHPQDNFIYSILDPTRVEGRVVQRQKVMNVNYQLYKCLHRLTARIIAVLYLSGVLLAYWGRAPEVLMVGIIVLNVYRVTVEEGCILDCVVFRNRMGSYLRSSVVYRCFS